MKLIDEQWKVYLRWKLEEVHPHCRHTSNTLPRTDFESTFLGGVAPSKRFPNNFIFNYTYLVFGQAYLTSDLELGWEEIQIPIAQFGFIVRDFIEGDWLTDWLMQLSRYSRRSLLHTHLLVNMQCWVEIKGNCERSAFQESSQSHR